MCCQLMQIQPSFASNTLATTLSSSTALRSSISCCITPSMLERQFRTLMGNELCSQTGPRHRPWGPKQAASIFLISILSLQIGKSNRSSMVHVRMKGDGAQHVAYLTSTQEWALLFLIPALRSTEIIARYCIGLCLSGQGGRCLRTAAATTLQDQGHQTSNASVSSLLRSTSSLFFSLSCLEFSMSTGGDSVLETGTSSRT